MATCPEQKDPTTMTMTLRFYYVKIMKEARHGDRNQQKSSMKEALQAAVKLAEERQ